MITTKSVFKLLLLSLFASLGLAQETSHWHGTLDARGNKLRLEIKLETSEGKMSGELTSLDQANAKLKLTDLSFDKTTLAFKVPKIRAHFSGKISDEGNVVEGTFSQSGMQLPLKFKKGSFEEDKKEKSDEKLREAWIGKLDIGVMKPVMQFRVVTKESGKTGAYFDSISEGRTGFEATVSNDGDQLRFQVDKIRLTFEGELTEGGSKATGTWKQGGRSFPLVLEKKSSEYDNENVWENRPQRPKAPFPYESLDVKFENTVDSLTLAGTLTIPEGEGRFPAVILISGSGPQDRDETLMEHKPFLVIADYLSRRGIAVLRYDDRGTNQSTGKFSEATTKDLANDTSAAVDFLKNHPRIAPEKIGLAGHSEGGLIAPLVIGFRNDVAFAIIMAGTGIDGAEIIRSQTKAMLTAAGGDPKEIETELSFVQAALTSALATKPGENLEEQLKIEFDKVVATLPEETKKEAEERLKTELPMVSRRFKSKWLQFFIRYDPRPALKKVQCPTLVIIGTKDTQVLPELNMPEIEKALKEAGNKDFEMVQFEGLNHMFQKAETGALGEYAKIKETFSPAALEKIHKWISLRFSK